MFVKKLSINILTLYEMFYKGLRRGILIFYANTFKLLTSKHMRLQKGDSNMQFQLQFITDELPQTPVHINQRTAVRGVIHYQNKILMVQTNRGDYKFPGGGMEEGETEKETLLREITEETGYTDIHIGVKIGETFEQNIDTEDPESYFQMKCMQINKQSNNINEGYVIMLKNITEFKELDSAKTTFISTISHELKTPISAIMMSLQLLEDDRVGDLNEEQKELAQSIQDNSERLLNITGELLNMTQVESGKLQLKPRITKPIELIEYAIKANRVQAEKFNIQIEVQYPENKIGKLFVDSEKIAWVLTNLLSNAIRYSPENGRIIIGARQTEDNHIEMYVRDFGKGIDPLYHQSIFDHYFRVPGTKVQGSGLGLSISKDFVGRMFKLPNHICICDDCMHKTMETVSQFDYQGMLNNPGDLNQFGGQNGFPNISFVNLADLQGDGGIPNKQKLKKKKKAEDPKPVFNIKDIPAPHKIKASLDEYVVGQEKAKKVISVAVYNHYKRVATDTMDAIEIEKSNILMIGPTGSGKTYLVKTLAKLLDVPLAIADATSLTEAGYIGDDIESVVSKLLAAAGNDVEKAEKGIIFIDEIDKIAKKKNTNSRDVSGESVQQGMLKLLEGAEVEVPVGANSKNAMVPLATVNTRNILFICGGAFPDLDEIIKERLTKTASIGFNSELKDKYDKDTDILSKVTVEDIRKFGMIPEFIGRLPIICTLQGLSKEMLVKILKEPKNAILKQYQKLLELDEVKLEFTDDALDAIAEKAMKRDTGARALRSIIEDFMLDIMYEIPKDNNIGRVTITREYIEGTGGPIIDIRSNEILEPVENLKQIPVEEK